MRSGQWAVRSTGGGPCTQSKNQQTVPTPEGCWVLGCLCAWCLVLLLVAGPLTGTFALAQQSERGKAKGPLLHSFPARQSILIPTPPPSSPPIPKPHLLNLAPSYRPSVLDLAALVCQPPFFSASTRSRQQSSPTSKMREIVSCLRPPPQKKPPQKTRRRPKLLSHPLPLNLWLPHHRDHTHGQASKTSSTPWEEH
jgi:hypothetical protein